MNNKKLTREAIELVWPRGKYETLRNEEKNNWSEKINKKTENEIKKKEDGTNSRNKYEKMRDKRGNESTSERNGCLPPFNDDSKGKYDDEEFKYSEFSSLNLFSITKLRL